MGERKLKMAHRQINYFFGGFFCLAFGADLFFTIAGFVSDASFFEGCFPRYASLIASISASVYNPVGPIYLNGFRPRLLNRILTASEVISNRLAISETGIPSIIYHYNHIAVADQVKRLKSYSNITLKRYMGQNDTAGWSKGYTFFLKNMQFFLPEP
jgi:hypothetical protein